MTVRTATSPGAEVRATSPPSAAEVLGIPLALTDYDGALEWMDAAAAARRRSYVCVAAVHTVMACQEDPALREAVLGADFTVPDGQPLVWALNLLGNPIAERVYGPELMDRACARAARTGARFYLYGGRNPRAPAPPPPGPRPPPPRPPNGGGDAPPLPPPPP